MAAIPRTTGARFPSGARGMAASAKPHGGKLVNLMVTDPKAKEDAIKKCNVAEFELSERQACDVELLSTGAFSPLDGFMNEDVWCVVHPL